MMNGTALLSLSAIVLVACGGGSASVADREAEAYFRAQAAYAAGRYAEAASLADTRRSFVPSLVLRGKALYFLGKEDAAEEVLERALKERPGSAEAALYLAHARRSLNRSDDARSAVEGLLADNPSDLRALRLAAELAAEKGDAAKAAAYLDRGVEAASEAGLLFLSRARLRWIALDKEGALADLRAAETLFPPGSAAAAAAAALALRIQGETL